MNSKLTIFVNPESIRDIHPPLTYQSIVKFFFKSRITKKVQPQINGLNHIQTCPENILTYQVGFSKFLNLEGTHQQKSTTLI